MDLIKFKNKIKKIKIKKRNVFALALLVVFILLLITFSMYQTANIRLQKKEFWNGPPLEINKKNIFVCNDDNIDTIDNIKNCDYITSENLKLNIDKNIRDLRKPFIFEYHNYLLPFIGVIGIIIGMIVYYIMSDKVNNKQVSLYKNTDIILKMLSKEQREIIQNLLNNNGKLRQYELVNLSEFNKVKIHRILRELENDNIIKKEKIGKVNNIILNSDIYNILK
jgi:uncharacterized membrane protein